METMLTPEQHQKLLSYIKERRYGYMIRMIVLLVYAALVTPLAIMELYINTQEHNDAEIAPSSIVTLSADQMHSAVYVSPNVLAVRRYRYRRGRPVEFLATWILAVIIGVVMFLRGYGIKFGHNSDYDCVKRLDYTCQTKPYGGKSEDTHKHPYFLMDMEGSQYCCPVFLDYKNADTGSFLTCVILNNGSLYAYLDREHSREWWEEDQ